MGSKKAKIHETVWQQKKAVRNSKSIPVFLRGEEKLKTPL
jgi:hypothetical protein